MIATYTLGTTSTRFSFWMSLLFCTFQKVPFALKTDKDSSVIRYCSFLLKFTSPLFYTISIIAVIPTLSMIPEVTLPLPDAEVSFPFFLIAKARSFFFCTESKSDSTFLKTYFSKSLFCFSIQISKFQIFRQFFRSRYCRFKSSTS